MTAGPAASRTAIVAQNTLAQVGARVLSMLASVAVIPVLTRYLGPNLFGDYALVITLNAFLMSVADLGIQTVATRDASQAPDRMPILASQAFLLRTLGTILLAGTTTGILLLTGYSHGVKVGFAIMTLTVFFNALQTGFAVILQSSLRLYWLGLSDVVGRLVSTGLILLAVALAVRLSLSKETAMPAIFVAMVVGSLVSLLLSGLIVRQWAILRNGFRSAVAWRMLKDALPLGTVTVASLILYRVDTILLSILRGSHDVGIYNLSYRFLDLLIAIPGLFMASVFPVLSAHASDAESFRRIWQKALDALALAGVPLALGTFLAAPHLIRLFGGNQFALSVGPLQILSFAVLLSYLDFAFPHALIIANRQAWILVIMVIGLVINIGLNLIFIPTYSYNAAAAVTLVSGLVDLLLAYVLAVRTYGYSLSFAAALKAVLAGSVMLGVLYPFREHNLALLVVAGAVIYGVGVVLLRALDIRAVRELLPRL